VRLRGFPALAADTGLARGEKEAPDSPFVLKVDTLILAEAFKKLRVVPRRLQR
jgi:hypothetical protein